MVQSDAAGDSQKFLTKLFRCHQCAAQIFSDDPNCSLTQFSDSIVISKPYDANSFAWFAIRVAEYQRLLLDEELLCRGGIAVNKHFSNGTFTFSAGLIAAYRIESKAARYPRVVISPEIMELIFPDKKTIPSFLIKEDDGLLFIDYIGLTSRKRKDHLKTSINNVIDNLMKSNHPSVREKGLWLAAYSDGILETSLRIPKFKGKKIKA